MFHRILYVHSDCFIWMSVPIPFSASNLLTSALDNSQLCPIHTDFNAFEDPFIYGIS